MYHHSLAKKYGMTVEQYAAMAEAQGGVCKICQKPQAERFRLAVDHCHVTGRIRGLLCVRCNRSLGQFMESPAMLRRAADYLEGRI